jgi:hypothetical protein
MGERTTTFCSSWTDEGLVELLERLGITSEQAHEGDFRDFDQALSLFQSESHEYGWIMMVKGQYILNYMFQNYKSEMMDLFKRLNDPSSPEYPREFFDGIKNMVEYLIDWHSEEFIKYDYEATINAFTETFSALVDVSQNLEVKNLVKNFFNSIKESIEESLTEISEKATHFKGLLNTVNGELVTLKNKGSEQ